MSGVERRIHVGMGRIHVGVGRRVHVGMGRRVHVRMGGYMQGAEEDTCRDGQ